MIQDDRERRTGMRQSIGEMIAKIAIGVIFIILSFQLLFDGKWDSFACGICIGLALMAWGLIPYLRAKKND